jgi:hypothetical protein
MNVPLRALSWAIRFFWLITLAFAVTCVYSATLISVEFGESTPAFDEASFRVTLPITLDNRGYYSISDLNFTTTIADDVNSSGSEASSFVPEIPPQSETTILHNVSLDMSSILTQADYLFNDSDLTLHGSISLSYASLIPFGFEASTAIPWGAPLFNLTVGTPEYSPYDAVSLRARLPISFQNHSPYLSVTGTIHVEIFDSRNQLLGEDTIFVDVPSNTAYDGAFETLVNAATVTRGGEVHVSFETEMFDYGPVVISYG